MNNRMTYAEQQRAQKQDMKSGIGLTLVVLAMAVPLIMMVVKELSK